MDQIILDLIIELLPLAKQLVSGALTHEQAVHAYDAAVLKANAAVAALPAQLAANDAAADAELHKK